MALIRCADCGRDISGRANQCVGCGAPVGAELGSAEAVLSVAEAVSQPAQEPLGRIAIVTFAVVVIGLAWWAPFDAGAEQTVDSGLDRAFLTFAAARTLNGVISVAQGTEISLGIGASTTLSVGEILDPLNDAVEKFSNLMLLATISFGMQKMLLAIGGHWSINASLTVIALLPLFLRLSARPVPDLVRGALILLILARFAVPLVSAGSELVFDTFLEQPYERSSEAIGAAAEQVGAIQEQVEAESGSIPEPLPQASQPNHDEPSPSGGPLSVLQDFGNKWTDVLTDLAERINPMDKVRSLAHKYEGLQANAEEIAKNLVDLAVVFLLQTLVLPLLFLWCFYYLLRSTIGPRSARTLPPPTEWPDRLKLMITSKRSNQATPT